MTLETYHKARMLVYEIEEIKTAIERITDHSKCGAYVLGFISQEEADEIQKIVSREIEQRLGTRLNTLMSELSAL